MGLLDGLRGGSTRERELEEKLDQALAQGGLLQENLHRLEDSVLSDEGWRRLSASADQEFTRAGIDRITETSRALYMSSPLIKRAVDVTSYYTWAQGVTFTASDDAVQADVVDAVQADEGNRAELYSHQARILTDVDQQVDGNVFLSLETDPTTGFVSIRSIPVGEIREIYTQPGNRMQVQYYRRQWNEQTLDLSTGGVEVEAKEALYPDYRYQPDSRPDVIGGMPVRWDAPIIHQKTGGLKHMQFGVPETYAAFDWARAYKKFLEDWHTLVASLAKFAWRVSTKAKNVNKAKGQMEGTDRYGVGSAFIGVEGSDISPIPKTGATTSADDARPSRLMVAAATGLPDTILSGDANVGNFATSKTLDRPTELQMRSRQTMWADLHRNIFTYAAEQWYRKRGGTVPADLTFDISFPSILEHDQDTVIKSIVAAATLDGRTEAGTIPRDLLSKILMEELGVEDIDTALSDLDSEQETQLEQAVDDLAEILKQREG